VIEALTKISMHLSGWLNIFQILLWWRLVESQLKQAKLKG